ncbi:ALK and LTK ligand 2b [Sardina pilchardus]|uniref:ALK and LTK ligand 2b n=1 Tax=Sardina pilchardus TaxID=27697 RepID=UPI002E15F7DD
MSALRTPVLIGLLLLIFTAGYCKQSAVPTGVRDGRSLLELIMDKVRVAREHHAEDSESGVQHASRKQEYSIETKEVNEVNKSQHNEQILEIFPRDLRQKDKLLKHLTGPLYFSPKCSKLFYRLYHNTRDCTIPAYYKRCARLLIRLAGSQKCTDG